MNNNVPTQPPGLNDTVYLGVTNNNCRIYVNNNPTIQDLMGNSLYTGTLTLDGVLTVDENGAMTTGSVWSANMNFVNTVNGVATGALDIHATNFNWNGGTIGSGNVVGEVCVDNNAVLTILDSNSA